jgi:hypothetical protein
MPNGIFRSNVDDFGSRHGTLDREDYALQNLCDALTNHL